MRARRHIISGGRNAIPIDGQRSSEHDGDIIDGTRADAMINTPIDGQHHDVMCGGPMLIM